MAQTENKKKEPKKVSLQAFLTTKPLSRAEITYYTRHFGQGEYKELTIVEWSELTGLK